MNQGISFPCASRTGKYRWCSCIVAISTSAGSSRNCGSNRPASGTGHSTRPVTSSSSASSMTAMPSSFAAAAVTPARMLSRRAFTSAMTLPRLSSVPTYDAGLEILSAFGAMKRWP